VTSSPTSTDAWSSKFRDEFDGRALHTDRWNYRQLGILSPESSRTYAQSSEDAVRVADGSLRLMVKQNPERSGYYLNGHIGTQDTFSFRYGVAAARVKFQEPRGQHGAFWIQTPTGTVEPGNPEVSGAEIDVAEFFGKGYPKGGLAHFSYHYNADEEWERVGDVMPSANKALVGDDAWWKNYHVFSVEWTPGQYIFRIDGVETYRSTRGVSGRSEYLILSLLTSDWELPKLDENKLPSTMHVDWVRVWQQ
jgi:beta-glucanase (GH16 family)